MQADRKNTIIVLALILSDAERVGNIAVTIPQAAAIRTVFDPDISLILRYLAPKRLSGTSLMLYERPSKLMRKRIKKEAIPIR